MHLHSHAYQRLLAFLAATTQSGFFPADERLVDLDPAGEPLSPRTHQYRTKPLQHRPRRLVRADLEGVAAFGYWPSLQGKQVLSASLSLTATEGSAAAEFGVSAWWACSAGYAGATCNNDASRRYATASAGGPGSVTTLDVTQLVGTWHFFGVGDGMFGFGGDERPSVYTYKRFEPPVLTPPCQPSVRQIEQSIR